MENYYTAQIRPLIDTAKSEPIRLKLEGEMECTNWLNISKRQAEKILAILNEGK